MRTLRIIATLLCIGALGYVLFPYYSPYVFWAGPCKTPILYSIGSLDTRFGISKAEFQTDIEKGASLWSVEEGKPLFKYDLNGSLKINLVYDSRQAVTQKENVLNARIQATSAMADSVKKTFTDLQDDYSAAEVKYQNLLAAYRAAQDAYNQQVEYWNARGGAPKTEYQALTQEKDALQSQGDTLESARQSVNSLASQINALIDKYNVLAGHVNSDVQTINTDGLAGTEFEEGRYVSDSNGTRIDIFQFKSQTDLLRVLAHELGHALSLDHNTNPQSIMSPLNQGKNFVLSKDDKQELDLLCGREL